MSSLMNNAPLTKEEQEEEEMRSELKEAGLYDENMGVEQMKQYVRVLNESKNYVKMHGNDTPDASMHFDENGSSQDTSKVTGDGARTLPSFSYRQAASSGILSDPNSEEIKIDKMSQASSSNSFEKNYTANSPDSEPIYDKNSNCKKDDDYPALGSRYKTRSTTGDGPRTRSQETRKMSLANAKKASMERWLLDLDDFASEKNPTPLSQPSDSPMETLLPYCREEIDLASEEFDQMCEQVVQKLSAFNSQFIMESEAGDRMSAPIKLHENLVVGCAGKQSAKEKTSTTITTPGSSPSTRNSYERATKRKALSTIAAATTIDNDENDDDESSNTKKRKFPQGKKEEEVAKKSQENKKNKNTSESIETISIDDFKDNVDEGFDNANLHNIRKSSNKKVLSDNGSDEQQSSQYPRRIEPPNPSKKGFKGPRAKKKNSTFVETKSDSVKFLDDDEINKTLQEIDEQIDESDCVEITNDIKPPSSSKRVIKRLQTAANHLENARESREQKLKDEEEEKQRKEEEERLKQDEKYGSYLQEEEDKETRRLESERKMKEQNEFYRNVIGNKSRVTRSSFQSKKTDEDINEDLLLDGDDDELTVTNVIQSCPICQKRFPANQIEKHASGCDSYASDSNDTFINKPSTSRFLNIYKCHICDKFETSDGNIYEEHVVECKNKSRSHMNGSWLS